MSEQLQEMVKRVQSLGFDVYTTGKDATWLVYSDGSNFAYMQWDQHGLIQICTKNKPHRNTGTGYRIHERLAGFTKQDLLDGFIVCPHWDRSNACFVSKYKNEQDFLSHHLNTGYTKVEAQS